MSFPILQKYLARLSDATGAASSIWLDHEGKAQGRFFNCTMSSAFQPIRQLDGKKVQAYEGLARSVSAQDQGLSLWKLLDHAASDDESIELDRLCRMLHSINFFRQAGDSSADLYLNVHDRLLSAVSSNHGHAFRRILDALELPVERVVLQLPAATPQQGWLLNYVSDNYRRNGFRFAVNVNSARDGLAVLDRLRPDVFKLDARGLQDEKGLLELLQRSAAPRPRCRWCSSGWKRRSTWRPCANSAQPQVCCCWCRVICWMSRARCCWMNRRGAQHESHFAN